LRLELRGTFDDLADAQAIKSTKFNRLLSERMQKNGQEVPTLESMYVETKGAESLKQQRALNLKPVKNPEAKEKLVLDAESYRLALREQLLETQEVTAGDLRQLALERAKALRGQLVEKLHIEDARVFILEPEMNKMNDKQQVVSSVTLSAG
jgi:hypothetical protein